MAGELDPNMLTEQMLNPQSQPQQGGDDPLSMLTALLSMLGPGSAEAAQRAPRAVDPQQAQYETLRRQNALKQQELAILAQQQRIPQQAAQAQQRQQAAEAKAAPKPSIADILGGGSSNEVQPGFLPGEVLGGGPGAPITFGRNPRTGTYAFNNYGWTTDPTSDINAPDWLKGRTGDIAQQYASPEMKQRVTEAHQALLKGAEVSGGVNKADLVKHAQIMQQLTKGGYSPTAAKEIADAAVPSFGKQAKTAKEEERKTKQEEAESGKSFERENKLSDDFRAESKDYLTVRDSFSRIQQTGKQATPAGDLSMVFNYMKMLDPGSVVRESEFRQAATAKPLLERVGLSWDALQTLWQGNKLTPQQRQDFFNQAQGLYDSALEDHTNTAGVYRQRAARAGLNPENVVIDYDTTVRERKKKQKAGAEAIQPAQGKTLPMSAFNDAMMRFKGDKAAVHKYFKDQGVTEFK